jgi:hypothetical protein
LWFFQLTSRSLNTAAGLKAEFDLKEEEVERNHSSSSTTTTSQNVRWKLEPSARTFFFLLLFSFKMFQPSLARQTHRAKDG